MKYKNEDVRMLEIYREIATVIASLSLCASEKEYESMINAGIEKMDDSYCEMELWLSSKTDYEFLNISEIKTIKSFAMSAKIYLNENRATHSGMDIDKGYYNINDCFYMRLEGWYDAYIKRLAQAKVQELSDLQEIVTLLKQQITEPQPEQANDRQTTDAQSLNPEPQQDQPKPTRGRGRPKETFKDKMIDDADGSKLKKVHTKIDGRKGKDVALIILACIKKGWLTKPTYTQVKNEFGDIGDKTGYNRYLNGNKFIKEELEGAINSLD